MDIFEMYQMLQPLLVAATGDDSKPWLIAVCLIISLAIMVFLFILGKGDDTKNHKRDDKK